MAVFDLEVAALAHVDLRRFEEPCLHVAGCLCSDDVRRIASIFAAHANGVDLPPIVVRRQTQQVELLDGQHRLFVARQLGLIMIRAVDGTLTNVEDDWIRANRRVLRRDELFPHTPKDKRKRVS